MLRLLVLLLLFVANVVLIRKLAPYKETLAGGIELTLAGVFLSGYWFGAKTGILLGLLFMVSSYLVNFDISPSMFIAIPISVLLVLFGAIAAKSGMTLAGTAMIGILIYCIVTDLVFIKLVGDNDYYNMFMTDAGILATNWLVFHLLF